MKLLIASDIHGSVYYLEKLIDRYNIEKPDKIILLGDYLYHGPRNDLPKDYNPKKVVELLNNLKEKIIGVRGNCDSEVDQMVLEFPIMSDYNYLNIDGVDIYLTHGHIYNQNNPIPGSKGIVLYGHTHVASCETIEGITYINPGSISIPKQDSKHSYLVYEDKMFKWIDLIENKVYKKISI